MAKYEFEIEVGSGQYRPATVSARNYKEAERRSSVLAGGCPVRNLRVRRTRNPLLLIRDKLLGRDEKGLKLRARLTPEQLLVVTQQLAVLLDCGVSLLPALNVLLDNASGPPREVLEKVSQDIDNGCLFSQALGNQPEVFSTVYRRSIKAGEHSGKLHSALHSLTQQLTQQVATSRRIKSALTYPACVVFFAGLMVAFLVYYQVPSFLRFFNERGEPLPSITQVLVFLSNPKLGMILLGTLLGGALYVRQLNKTAEGRNRLFQRIYRLPLLARILRLRDVGQMSNELSVLLENGVDLVTALKSLISEDTVSPYFASLSTVVALVEDGESLTSALELQRQFPAMLTSMTAIGEESGHMCQGLKFCGHMLLDEMNEKIDVMLQLVEPLAMGGLGLVVVFVAMACFLPTYQLMMGG